MEHIAPIEALEPRSRTIVRRSLGRAAAKSLAVDEAIKDPAKAVEMGPWSAVFLRPLSRSRAGSGMLSSRCARGRARTVENDTVKIDESDAQREPASAKQLAPDNDRYTPWLKRYQ